MKAIVIRAYGGPEVMKLDDVELPAPGAGEALVDVAVSGVNFMDTGTRRGYTKAMRTSRRFAPSQSSPDPPTSRPCGPVRPHVSVESSPQES